MKKEKYRSSYSLGDELDAKVRGLKMSGGSKARIDATQFDHLAELAGIYDRGYGHATPGTVTPHVTIAGVQAAGRALPLRDPTKPHKGTFEIFIDVPKPPRDKPGAGRMRLTEPQESMVLVNIAESFHDDDRKLWWPRMEQRGGTADLVFSPGHAARIAKLFEAINESEGDVERLPHELRSFHIASARAARQLAEKFRKIALTTPQKAVVTIKYKPKLYGGRVVR